MDRYDHLGTHRDDARRPRARAWNDRSFTLALLLIWVCPSLVAAQDLTRADMQRMATLYQSLRDPELPDADLRWLITKSEQAAHPDSPPMLFLCYAARTAIHREREQPGPGTRTQLRKDAERYHHAATHHRGAKKEIGAATELLCSILVREGEIERARNLAQAGLTLLADSDPYRAYLEQRLADCEAFDQRWNKAWKHAETARDLLDKNTAIHQPLEPLVLARLAAIRLGQGLPDLAWRWIERARQSLEVLADDPRRFGPRSFVHLTAIRAQLVRGDFEGLIRSAKPLLDDAELLRRRPQTHPALLLRTGIAHAHLARRSEEHAVQARQSLATAAQHPWVTTADRVAALLRLAQLELDADREAAARIQLERAEAVLDDAKGATPVHQRVFLDSLRLRAAMARQPAVASTELQPLGQALAQSATGLADRWLEAAPRPGGLGFLHDNVHREILGALIDYEMRMEPATTAGHRALQHVLDAERVGTLLRRMRPASDAAVDLSQLGRVLVYLPTRITTHRFEIRAGAVVHHRGPGLAELLPQITEFRRWVATSPHDAMGEATRKIRGERIAHLGKSIQDAVAPTFSFRKQGRHREVTTIVGRDLLHELPFEALQAAFWGPLADAPSVRALARLRSRRLPNRNPSDPTFSFIGAPTHGPAAQHYLDGAPQLRLTTPDRKGLCAPFGDSKKHWLIARHATRSALAKRPPTEVLTVLAHGVSAPDRERAAGLLLAPDADGQERVFAEDLEAQASAKLVVLATCGAGSGPARRGDSGAAHLGGALLFQSTNCVILADRRMALAPTLAILKLLNEELMDGATASVALFRAQTKLRKQGRWTDPFDTAGLRVFGDGNVRITMVSRGFWRPIPPGGSVWAWLFLIIPLATLAYLAYAIKLRPQP